MPDLSMLEIPSFGVILDLLVIIAVAGLWSAWWRNLNRLQKTEQLLAESIEQLEQASSQLQAATEHIRRSEQDKRIEGQARTRRPARKVAAPAADSSSETVLARTLRLQRQGKTDEEIAESLSIPISQVRLMLTMHAARAN